MNPGKERRGGNVEMGLTPFLFYLSWLILELAMHCSRIAAGVCVLTCLFHLVLGFLPGDTWVQRRKETMGQCSHSNWGLAECDAPQLSLISDSAVCLQC